MKKIETALSQAIKFCFDRDETVEVTVAPAETGADYATNIALKLAKALHQAPMQIAERLKEWFEQNDYDFAVAVAAPGFLNFTLSDDYFQQTVVAMTEDMGGIISRSEYSGRTVVTEFSDPNPFKVLHVGHLYTSIVGDSISSLLELAGARVVRTNFGGDVGLHVGKTLWAVMRHNYSPGDITIEEIARCYVEGTAAYEEDETARQEITNLNKQIYRIAALGEMETTAWGGEEGELARLYWRGRELSYDYFKQFYAEIGVKFDKFYPESTVADKGLEEVRAHIGETYEESDGAIVYRGEKVGLHTRVFINREGVPTYETKDVGLLFTKWADWKFDQSVVITGNEQSDYMKVVLASVKEYAPELVERTRHLTHGLVKLPGNVKMSSRKGNFLKAVDVLALVREELGGEQADEKVVLAAIKYAFLKYKMGGDIIFDPKESVAMNGNSGVYLLYAVVRAKRILQKMAEQSEPGEGSNKKVIQDAKEDSSEAERALSKKIIQYQDVIAEAVNEMAPYKICNYLYELAQEFSRFYERVRVVGSDRAQELQKLVEGYRLVMEHGLGVLGIEAPDAM